MNKLKYLLILALALTMSIGVWAQGHQRYTSAVNLSGLQVGDTWQDIVDRNPSLIAFNGGIVWTQDRGYLIDSNSNEINPTTLYDSNAGYQWAGY